MSFLTFLRFPTDSGLGELMLIDPLQRRALGYFEIRKHWPPEAPPMRLYFNYETDLSKTDNPNQIEMYFIKEREKRYDELKAFFDALMAVQPMSPRCALYSIVLPHGEPWIAPPTE